MIIAKNDEEKRSRIWRIVTITTTVLIIVIAIFFITKLFTANPLEGTWAREDADMNLTVRGSSTVTVEWKELREESNVKLKMEYAMDKEAKTFTIRVNEAELKKAADSTDGRLTDSMLRSAVSPFATTFDYSVDGKRLTLTEREYGEQMVFIKK